MYCISASIAHTVEREPTHPSHRRSTCGRNWPFLQDRVPPLLVQIQTPADNQSESMLCSIHVSLPGHSSLQLMNIERGAHGSTWRDCCVFLHNRIPISSHKPLRSQANFHFVHAQRNDLVKLANGRHQYPPNVYRPGTSSLKLQQSKLVFLVANVTTRLHVGQDHSSPILSANPTPVHGQGEVCGQNTLFQDFKTPLQSELMNAHLTATSPSLQLLSLCATFEHNFVEVEVSTCLACTRKLCSLEAIKLSHPIQFHVGPMHDCLFEQS